MSELATTKDVERDKKNNTRLVVAIGVEVAVYLCVPKGSLPTLDAWGDAAGAALGVSPWLVHATGVALLAGLALLDQPDPTPGPTKMAAKDGTLMMSVIRDGIRKKKEEKTAMDARLEVQRVINDMLTAIDMPEHCLSEVNASGVVTEAEITGKEVTVATPSDAGGLNQRPPTRMEGSDGPRALTNAVIPTNDGAPSQSLPADVAVALPNIVEATSSPRSADSGGSATGQEDADAILSDVESDDNGDDAATARKQDSQAEVTAVLTCKVASGPIGSAMLDTAKDVDAVRDEAAMAERDLVEARNQRRLVMEKYIVLQNLQQRLDALRRKREAEIKDNDAVDRKHNAMVCEAQLKAQNARQAVEKLRLKLHKHRERRKERRQIVEIAHDGYLKHAEEIWRSAGGCCRVPVARLQERKCELAGTLKESKRLLHLAMSALKKQKMHMLGRKQEVQPRMTQLTTRRTIFKDAQRHKPIGRQVSTFQGGHDGRRSGCRTGALRKKGGRDSVQPRHPYKCSLDPSRSPSRAYPLQMLSMSRPDFPSLGGHQRKPQRQQREKKQHDRPSASHPTTEMDVRHELDLTDSFLPDLQSDAVSDHQFATNPAIPNTTSDAKPGTTYIHSLQGTGPALEDKDPSCLQIADGSFCNTARDFPEMAQPPEGGQEETDRGDLSGPAQCGLDIQNMKPAKGHEPPEAIVEAQDPSYPPSYTYIGARILAGTPGDNNAGGDLDAMRPRFSGSVDGGGKANEVNAPGSRLLIEVLIWKGEQ